MLDLCFPSLRENQTIFNIQDLGFINTTNNIMGVILSSGAARPTCRYFRLMGETWNDERPGFIWVEGRVSSALLSVLWPEVHGAPVKLSVCLSAMITYISLQTEVFFVTSLNVADITEQE